MLRMMVSLLVLLIASTGFAKEYLVKYKPGMKMSFVQGTEIKVLDSHESARLLKVDIPSIAAMGVVNQLQDRADVEYVVENFKLEAIKNPPTHDQLKAGAQALREQWALKTVGADGAWSQAGNKGDRRITVAVIDTGVDYRHESLRPNMVDGYDFLRNDNDPMDETGQMNPGHGTHCAGVIGATGLVENGTIGLSPNVSIMPLRFLGANGQGDLMAGIKSIDFAIQKGAQVISASWGAKVNKSQATPLIEAVQRADAAGVVFVVAAGNDGTSNDKVGFYPANANTPNMINVAASNISDAKPYWSNFGKHSVDVASPGENIMSTIPNNAYSNMSGTSMATPLVAGLVALLLAQDESMTGVQVRSLIQSTAAKINLETACDCRIDANSAMTALKNQTPFVVPYAETVEVGGEMQFSMHFGREPFNFESSNAAVASIDQNGMLKGVAKGETTVTVSDADGNKASSYKIYVGQTSGGGGGGGGGGGPGGQCPFDDPAMCDFLCQIQPDLPFCSN